MATFSSEDLNEPEEVSKGATRLTGWHLRSTGRRDRLVWFRNKNTATVTVLVPPGGIDSMSGLNESFPNGLSIESKGDGKLIANVFYEKGKSARSRHQIPFNVEVLVNAEG